MLLKHLISFMVVILIALLLVNYRFQVICSVLTVDVANSNATNQGDPETILNLDEANCSDIMGVSVGKCEDCAELGVNQSGNVKLYNNSNGKNISSCVDFGCSQTAVISSESDYERFERLSCRELSGDLIMTGFQFDDNKKYTALESLEKIWGKLVIDRSSGNFDLSFESLTGLSEKIRLDPVLQITRNTLKSISFPALEKIQNFETSSNRIVFGENFMFDDSSAVMPIYWKDTSLKSLLPVRMNVPAESKVKTRKIIEQEAWMDEKYLKKNEIPFRLFWVYRDFFAGCSYVHLALSMMFLSGSCVLFIAGCRRQKENYQFALEATDEFESDASESEASSLKASSSKASVFSTK